MLDWCCALQRAGAAVFWSLILIFFSQGKCMASTVYLFSHTGCCVIQG